MSREIEIKQNVLEMLKNFLMEQDGGKFKPKEVLLEVGKPEEASMEEDPAECDICGEDLPHEHDEEEEPDGKSRMSLKEFLASHAN